MTEEAEQNPGLRSIMRETLNDYRLSNMVFEGTDDAFCLVDLLSNDGEGATIESGQEEIDRIVDELATDLFSKAPDSTPRRMLDVLAVGTGGDAALNLEGAIDSLLIANKLPEDGSIIRTLRRVLGQLEEVSRLAEIENARAIRD
jgi:hypothetical protein